MPIFFYEKTSCFHLNNQQISYIIGIEKERYLTHRYWGKKIPTYAGSNQLQMIDRGFATNPFPEERTFSLNSLPLETSTQGNGDHRIANYQIRSHAGHTVTDFHYDSYEIYQGKQAIPGLPSLRETTAVTTLEILLKDSIQQLEMRLIYHLFENYPIITRRVVYSNVGPSTVTLENAGSMSIDLPKSDFELITLDGSHTNEANLTRQSIRSGIQRLESSRGTSSPQHQPFLALVDPYTSEFQGEVFSFHLVYSGNFVAQVELEQYGTTRVQVGIQPDHFEWQLAENEHFYTPEVVLNYSDQGLNGMSQNFHQIYQQHLVPTTWNKERPILLNTWEANYFELSEAELIKQAEKAAKVGIELFVLDDGWFGKRHSDDSSLGDWVVNHEKLPQGIHGLAQKVHDLGMQFGLWFEPEMISRKSQLFQQHPEWVLQVPDYPLTEGRQQLVLDLSQPAVQDYLITVLTDYLASGDIDYIKWDMNRHLTEVGSAFWPTNQQKEIGHRYVLGLYRILDHLTQQFPECLFENCSSGGGRFDPGMMYYMPQTWTSDNSDALCRSIIQYGYSYLYPPIMMGAHVSTTPNHQVGRVTSLETRGWLAMSGNFGYELDLQTLSDTEIRTVKQQINFYQNHRQLFQFGQFYRLQAPNAHFASAWLFTNDEEAIAIYFNGLSRPAMPTNYLKMHYLDPEAIYEDMTTQQQYSGAELNQAGVLIPRVKEDFHTHVFHWKKTLANNSL